MDFNHVRLPIKYRVAWVDGEGCIRCACDQCEFPGGKPTWGPKCACCGAQFLEPVLLQATEQKEPTAEKSATAVEVPEHASFVPTTTGCIAEEPGDYLAEDPIVISSEEEVEVSSVVMRLPADHYSGAGKEPAFTCVAEERSLVLPVQNQPERRSPTAVVTYSAEGGEDSIPSRRSGEIHPYPPQAPVVATAETGLVQARTEQRAEPSLTAVDVVLEEEVPVGNPTQDGGESSEMAVSSRPSSCTRLPGSEKSQQALRKPGSKEASEPECQSDGTGQGREKLRVVAPRMPAVFPYAQPPAIVKIPAPVTFSYGSQFSQGLSGESRATSEEWTGGNLDWGDCFTSDEGSGRKMAMQRMLYSPNDDNRAVGVGCDSKSIGSNFGSPGTLGVSSGDLGNVAHMVPIARGAPYVPSLSGRVIRDRQNWVRNFHHFWEGELTLEMGSLDAENWDPGGLDEKWCSQGVICYISRRCIREVYGHDPFIPLAFMPELWADCGCPVCHPECYRLDALSPVDHAVRKPP
ncbi:uncharacterized protein LOC142492533 [Ascaphus truei]|uniref:uncharacterized protein LOC142492533 n=1 Tax=Ascaphus truei TaxID=8439 RepID=UPI003F59753A